MTPCNSSFICVRMIDGKLDLYYVFTMNTSLTTNQSFCESYFIVMKKFGVIFQNNKCFGFIAFRDLKDMVHKYIPVLCI